MYYPFIILSYIVLYLPVVSTFNEIFDEDPFLRPDSQLFNENSIGLNLNIASLDVIGYASLNLKSHEIKVLILFSTYSNSASNALNQNKKKIKEFSESILKLGINTNSIEFFSYDIIAKYAVKMNYDDIDEVEGYTISQEIIINLDSKKKTVKIIDLAHKAKGILKSVNWVLPEKLQSEIKSDLISKAVEDSWSKAKLSVYKMGYKLVSLKSIRLVDNQLYKNIYSNTDFTSNMIVTVEVTYNIQKINK
jgi:uncharacterized protein YggE